MGAREAVVEQKRLLLGGMARWWGVDFFGPNYMSSAERRDDKIYVWIEPFNMWRPKDTLGRVLEWPILRSLLFWARFLILLAGSLRALISFVAIMAALWVFVSLMEVGTESIGGPVGDVLAFFAAFPILPALLPFFVAMKFTPIGRYHGAEHKAVAAYEKHGEVTLEGAKGMSRIHPRCGTNILIYIILVAFLDPFIDWTPFAVLQFILISEAWFIFGKTRVSIIVGNFLQRYFTTSEPHQKELEVAVESLKELLRAEAGERGADKEPVLIPARY